jgi:membrane protein
VKIVPPTEIGQAASVPLSNWLQDRVREAEQVNFAAIGWVGVAVTIYAAISLMVTIEECFNIIYRAAQGRPWTSRVPVYWFLLTLSPLLIVVGNYIDTRFQDLLTGSHAPPWVLTGLTWLWSAFVIWLLMGAVYTLFPNAKVHLRPAMIGALVAAVLLEIGKRTMGLYLQNALSLSQLYGSLGLIPLFMFWVYLMWLAVLFGLQVSSTLQQLHGRDLTELSQGTAAAEMVDPNRVIVMMRQTAQRFRAGRAADVDEVAEAAGVPAPLAKHVVDALVAARLLHRLAEPEGSIVLARPPEEISVDALLAVAHGLAQHAVGDPRTAELLESLQRVQRENVAGLSLASLIT